MKTPANNSMLLAAALGLLLIGVEPGDGLTIYRIGDTSDPICSDPNAKCFDWDKLTNTDNFGLRKEVATLDGFLRPEQLNPDVNLVPLIRQREHGSIKSSNSYGWQDEDLLDLLFDGDLKTTYQGLPPKGNGVGVNCGNFTGGFSTTCKGIWFKLGGLFPIDRVVFYTSPEFANERFVPNFRVGTNDELVERDQTDAGTLPNTTREGYISWRSDKFFDFDITHEFRENTSDSLDLKMPDTPISEIIFAGPVEATPPWEIAEFEIYGAGFASEASYVTELISLDDFSSLGELTWGGEAPDGARVDLSMRTGDDTTPDIFWRWDYQRGGSRTRLGVDGEPMDRFDYFDDLSDGEKAGITPDKDNWEFWSPPLEFDRFRAGLVGTKPRRYVQIRADFISNLAAAGGRLDFLQFEVSSPPLASQILAEIVPLEAPLGEVVKFTYKLKPSITEGSDLGFNGIQIFTPLAPASVDTLRFANTVLEQGEFTLVPHDGESFMVQLPEGMEFVDREVIDVVFHTAVFKVGTVFNARVFNSDQPGEVRQRVTVGDADPLVDSSSLSVVPSDIGKKVITALRVAPLTPNNDQANDMLSIEYDLVNLDDNVPVTIGVYTLAGTQVADIPVTTSGSGRWTETWNGIGRGGDLVPPGLYVLRLKVDSDTEEVAELATFPVVY